MEFFALSLKGMVSPPTVHLRKIAPCVDGSCDRMLGAQWKDFIKSNSEARKEKRTTKLLSSQWWAWCFARSLAKECPREGKRKQQKRAMYKRLHAHLSPLPHSQRAIATAKQRRFESAAEMIDASENNCDTKLPSDADVRLALLTGEVIKDLPLRWKKSINVNATGTEHVR